MGQLERGWRFVKPYMSKYYIAFFSGGVGWMLLDVYATKGVDASFVSAVADTSLVVFAILALFQAKRIWEDRAKQDGYKIALDLLNHRFIDSVLVPDLNIWLFETENLLNSYMLLGNSTQGMSIPRIRNDEKSYIIRLRFKHDSLNVAFYNRIFPLSQEIHFDIFRLRNTGVDFLCESSGDMLRKHFDDFHLLSVTCDNYLSAISQYLSLHSDSRNPNEILISEDRAFVKERLSELINFNKNVHKLVNSMRDNLNLATKSKDKTILDYFHFK